MALCEASNGKGGAWNDAGTIVFAPSHNSPLHKVSAAGGESVELTEFDAKLGRTAIVTPLPAQWRPLPIRGPGRGRWSRFEQQHQDRLVGGRSQ